MLSNARQGKPSRINAQTLFLCESWLYMPRHLEHRCCCQDTRCAGTLTTTSSQEHCRPTSSQRRSWLNCESSHSSGESSAASAHYCCLHTFQDVKMLDNPMLPVTYVGITVATCASVVATRHLTRNSTLPCEACCCVGCPTNVSDTMNRKHSEHLLCQKNRASVV
jgi:hypothetical protein